MKNHPRIVTSEIVHAPIQILVARGRTSVFSGQQIIKANAVIVVAATSGRIMIFDKLNALPMAKRLIVAVTARWIIKDDTRTPIIPKYAAAGIATARKMQPSTK
jgi:hypothetical protein